MIFNARFLVPILLLTSLQSIAQKISDSTDIQSTTQVTFGTSFASKLHYFGRVDSLKSSAFIPSVSVKFTNGLYLTGSFIFVNNSNTSLAYTAAITEAGYRFGKSTGLAGSIYADKFFYTTSSELVQSVQKGQAGFSLSHLNNILDVNIGASAVFSDKTDYFTNAGVDHQFRISLSNAVILLTPTVAINAGTQNFTSTYYTTKRNVPAFIPIGFPGTTNATTTTVTNFQVLSYELSTPVTLVYNKFAFTVTPAYVIPQNVAAVANRPDLAANAVNLFYTNLGLTYTLGR